MRIFQYDKHTQASYYLAQGSKKITFEITRKITFSSCVVILYASCGQENVFFSAFAVVSGLPCWKAFSTPSRGGVGDSSDGNKQRGRGAFFLQKRPSAFSVFWGENRRESKKNGKKVILKVIFR